MTFQVPRANNDLNIDRSLSRITPSAESTSTPKVAEILAVGRVLAVNVHRQAQEGITYKGEFIKASLPDNIRHGEKLMVKVTENNELIVLKVIQKQSFESLAALKPQSALEVFLRSLMGQASVEQLKAAATSLAHLKSESLSGNTGLKELLAPQVLSTGRPEEVVKFLRLLSNSSLIRGIDQARQSVESITELASSESSQADRLLNELTRALESTLRAVGSQKSNGSMQASHISNVTFSNNTSLGATLDSILSLITQITSKPDFLAELRNSNVELVNLLFNLEKALNRSNRLTESGSKSVINLLSGMLEALNFNRRATQNQTTASDPVRAINSILRGQEALNLINPLMQAMGEPAIIFIPAFINGLLSKWEMAVYPRLNEDNSPAENDKKTEQFETVELFLTFEKLGDIQIKIACSQDELLVNFTASDKRLASLIESRKDAVLLALQKFTFNSINIACTCGKTGGVVPAWYQAMNRRSLVA
jgi:hypothetical protein